MVGQAGIAPWPPAAMSLRCHPRGGPSPAATTALWAHIWEPGDSTDTPAQNRAAKVGMSVSSGALGMQGKALGWDISYSQQ